MPRIGQSKAIDVHPCTLKTLLNVLRLSLEYILCKYSLSIMKNDDFARGARGAPPYIFGPKMAHDR